MDASFYHTMAAGPVANPTLFRKALYDGQDLVQKQVLPYFIKLPADQRDYLYGIIGQSGVNLIFTPVREVKWEDFPEFKAAICALLCHQMQAENPASEDVADHMRMDAGDPNLFVDMNSLDEMKTTDIKQRYDQTNFDMRIMWKLLTQLIAEEEAPKKKKEEGEKKKENENWAGARKHWDTGGVSWANGLRGNMF